jgi:hypothetical protein
MYCDRETRELMKQDFVLEVAEVEIHSYTKGEDPMAGEL